ncbi:alpha-2-macroglobulin family protein [Pasteurella canis]|uniref:Alpha-2-macroglobulin family protein n=1 Tax=Pasteurella canis TaxID=753 RepID=A0A379ESA0_9PAST|nr:alpha-2-macroglobulin family protein [Pasteurella canis]
MLEQHFNAKDWQSDTLSAWLSAAYQLLKQDEEAHKLLENVIAKLNSERDVQWLYRHYSDPLIQDSSMLYVIARHFPKELAKVSEKVLTRIAQDLNQQRYNTLSSAMVLLALDAYAQQNQAELSALHIQQNGQDISQSNSLFRYADLTETQMNLDFVNSSTQTAWFALSQSGYPQKADNKALSNGLEIYRTLY